MRSQAQRLVNHQSLYWLRYQNQLIVSPTFYWSNEVDNRRFFDPDVQHQFIFHSRFHYKRKRWDIGAGLTMSWIFAQKPENGFDHSTAEVRPVAEVSYDQPIGKIVFQNRLRIDNRFIEENQEHNVWEESFYVLRIRYRAQFKIPLKVNSDNITTISLKVADEIMFNNEENTFDQNRLYLTGEFYLNKKLSLEAGYLYIYQQRFGLEEYFSRNVVRFSVLHRIQLK
jgi:Protein of unknown function (DUF2490)